MKTSFRTLILALGALVWAPVAQAQTPMELQTQADKAYDEKSYARALDLYRQAKAAGPVREPEKVEFRIVESLFKTEKWDDAIATATADAATVTWKARFHYVLGQIYVKAPKNGWKLGDQTWRQNEYPTVKGDQKPLRYSFYADDQKAAEIALETAKVEAQKERDLAMRARFVAPIYPLSSDEECDLNFDLAAYLPQVEYDDLIQTLEKRDDGNFDETIDPKAPYATGWSLPKKVLTLYAEIRTLDGSDDKGDTARSYLAEGLFVRAYRQRMDAWAQKWDDTAKKYVQRPYPFDDLDAITPWRKLVTELPKSVFAPQALQLIAQEQQNRNQLVKAVATWQELITKYPKSKLVSDARAALQQIEATQISFNLDEPARPGQKPKLNVNSNNVKQIQFAAYKVKLEDVLALKANLNNPNTTFTEFSDNFGTIADAIRKMGDPVAKWNLATGDKGDYQGQNQKTEVPLTAVGAYVVVASGNGVRFAQIVLISDLALLKKTDKNGSFVFVADAKTGEAVTGANVIIKEVWAYNPRRTDVAQGKSDDGGFFDKKRAGDPGSNISALAWVGDRYAITGQQGGYWYGNEGNESRVLGTTDRPVYRPGQTVNFRQIVTSRGTGGDWQPVVGKSFDVMASNTKGETFWKANLKTNEFGSVSGDFVIPTTAPLGQFSLSLTDNDRISGGTQFRVEEYKRPEFEVTVTAPAEAKRPGETVAARINAKYYFGSPVPNAKVKYTVRKSTWWASYQFPSPYDWLYSSWGVGQYDTGRRNIGGEGSGTIVKEGEVTTDAEGFAELSFKTDEISDAPTDWWSRYSNPLYTIEAEVTDQSRRTIEGQGSVKVARQPYFAFLDVKNGYFLKGDRVPVELRTQDANDQSVAATGKMVVYKLLPGDKEEKVTEAPISTDATGRAFWNWEATDSGQFRVEYQARGEWGDEIKAQTEIWVVGDNIGAIRLRGVTILLDKRSYEEGDVLKARLVADTPGANVLFTQEASGEILQRDVIHIDAQSKEVSIKIEKKHVPNFFLAAALIQDYEVYQAQAEVFVPPTRQLLTLKVTGDKAVYKPGETGTFQIEARDYSGAPARAEVSLALIDASLFYIQKDFTPDMRQFYYGDRRQNFVNLDSSRSGNPEARSESDQKTVNYETHGFELPDDFGQLQLMPGGFGYYPYGRRGLQTHFAIGGGVGGFGGRATDLENSVSDMPMPMAAPMMAASAGAVVTDGFSALKSARDARAPGSPAQAPAEVRSNFAETAYWSPSVITEGGKATVKITFPDSLTQWHATARGLTNTVQVGAAESDVATKKDLLVRLQAPRFFVERDQVVISANVHNYSATAQSVKVGLDLQIPGSSGLIRLAKTSLTPGSSQAATRVIQMAAGEEKRLDWTVEVARAGDANVQVTAQTATASDGVKMTFPVLVHGVQRFSGQSGTLPGTGKTTVSINFPKERKFGASELNLQLNPSLAAQMLDALPYLSDYPYGCVEQTMSRFLPTVMTEKTLRDAGINLETLRTRAKAYEAEAKTAARGDVVKNTGYSYPKGAPNSRNLEEMASQLWFYDRSNNPIFDKATIDKMAKEGLERLYGMQRGDGGWGWWSGSSTSDEYMSAYVVYGLSQAKNAGVNVKGDVLGRGLNYLRAQMKDEDNLNLLTYMAYALSQTGLDNDSKKIAAGRLFEQRDRLAPLSKSYLALALYSAGEKDKAGVLVRNLENTAQVNAENGTARYKSVPQYWCWWNNDTETVALALRAFDQIDPTNKLVPQFMKWLTLQARGNHYRSTKETAEVVYTLADYVTKNKELDVDYTLKVSLNGKIARTYHVTKDNALFFDNRFISGDLFLEDGKNTLTLEKTGKGNLYWNAYSEYFSLEEPIKASGNELSISRKFYKLTRSSKADQDDSAAAPPATPMNGRVGRIIAPPRPFSPPEPEYTRTEIKDGETVTSGDLIEVELVVNAKNDYEYLVFEDMKAAGFEPVDVRSGESYGDGVSSNVELRDDKVAFFVDRLPQGRQVLRYRVRAEVPGSFHALPTNGYAMYAPEVRAISDEMRVSVKD